MSCVRSSNPLIALAASAWEHNYNYSVKSRIVKKVMCLCKKELLTEIQIWDYTHLLPQRIAAMGRELSKRCCWALKKLISVTAMKIQRNSTDVNGNVSHIYFTVVQRRTESLSYLVYHSTGESTVRKAVTL